MRLRIDGTRAAPRYDAVDKMTKVVLTILTAAAHLPQ